MTEGTNWVEKAAGLFYRDSGGKEFRLVEEGTPEQIEQTFEIKKADDSKQIVFGWASVAMNDDGTPLVDHQGDMIDPGDLEDAAYLFTLNFREGDEMHTEEVKMHLVESMAFTSEKLQKFATDAEGNVDSERLAVLEKTFPPSWWVGFHIPDEDFYLKARDEYPMFSIAGISIPEKVEA